MTIRELLIVGVVFNSYWLLAVIGQSHYQWLLVICLLGCWWFYRDAWRFALILGTAGISMDIVLSLLGLFQFHSVVLPFWLVMLWLGFGSFVWVTRHIIVVYSSYVVIGIGGLGGMLSYLAGYRLGAVNWPLGITVTALSLFACWLCFSALTLVLIRRYDTQKAEEV
ncbi:DUF2878 domain-containing protein [Photobacterium sp. SDRW27]|uniref:DUF2878 family protein n=1 Tax=Photobacterium obscurum TaxID=2829490 RepID=UPI002243D0EB|nr:DUF2878 family protein [Photobacterium obscurum]MCW8329360.1 DUF2878 domain-containing protein [Photobacterium obscurum]